ncbi:MAG: hypothetical protein OCC45_02310 [Desulfotalea sp.]
MFERIGISVSLAKQVSLLEKSCKQAVFAVQQYQRILNTLKEADFHSDFLLLKRTKNGEMRMKNCIKYDLGGGYRLVSVKYKNSILLPFLGCHDDVDCWLSSNRHYIQNIDIDNFTFHDVIPLQFTNSDGLDVNEESNDIDQYEQELQSSVSDSILRKIFCGLVNPVKGKSC